MSDERRLKRDADQAHYQAEAARGGSMYYLQSSIAGASSRTSALLRRAEATEVERQRRIQADVADKEAQHAFEVDAADRQTALAEQRARNKKKRNKKRTRRDADDNSQSGSDAEKNEPNEPRREGEEAITKKAADPRSS